MAFNKEMHGLRTHFRHVGSFLFAAAGFFLFFFANETDQNNPGVFDNISVEKAHADDTVGDGGGGGGGGCGGGGSSSCGCSGVGSGGMSL